MDTLNKAQANALAVAGKKVKRADWPAGQYAYIKDGLWFLHKEGVETDERYFLKNTAGKEGKVEKNPDRTANDWKVYEDSIPEPTTNINGTPNKLAASFVNIKKEQKAK